MSFADLEVGRPLPTRKQQQQKDKDPSNAVAAGIFQINTAVSTFQRLVNTLGTPKDTLDLRDRLRKTRVHISQLVKETAAKLKEASETDLHFEVSASKKIADAKLAKDFQAVLKEFQKAQRLAAQRETAYSPFVPKEVPSSRSKIDVEEVDSFQRQEQQAQLLHSRREEVVLLDNELLFNEAVIEEREQGIQEIQQQIGEVNEIFKDLAVLVQDQGVLIDDISSHIENSHAATSQGTAHLVKAARAQRSSSSLGFRKVDPDRWEFANEGFLRGQKHLLKTISRRKPVHGHAHHQQPSIQSTPVKACVEVGKFGLEEEVERLKRDKNVLMQELVRLRQQQQTTDNQLQTVGQRVQVMEQRQQQMMSFLAKAMQEPGFLAQLVQQQNDGNRHVTGVNKKRRLPNHDEEIVGVESTHDAVSNGQIVKYQPLINEAAKSMLRQILKLNSPLPDQPLKDPNAFLIDHVPAASNVVDNVSCSTRTSGVTLSEVPQNSKQPSFPTQKGLPINRAPVTNPEIRASCEGSNQSEGQMPEADLHNSQGGATFRNDQMQGVLPENSLKFPDVPFSGTQNADLSFMDSLSTVQNGTLPMDMDRYSPGVDLDGLLPGSNDVFWEQFFPVSPLQDATEEVDSSTPEGSIPKENEGGQEEEWEKLHHMNHLTEQMGLLTAEKERV